MQKSPSTWRNENSSITLNFRSFAYFDPGDQFYNTLDANSPVPRETGSGEQNPDGMWSQEYMTSSLPDQQPITTQSLSGNSAEKKTINTRNRFPYIPHEPSSRTFHEPAATVPPSTGIEEPVTKLTYPTLRSRLRRRILQRFLPAERSWLQPINQRSRVVS